MANQNFSVKAILRKDKKRKDGKCPVNFRITINSIVVKLPSGEYTEETNWNDNDGFYKGSKSSIENSLLDNEMSKIKKFLREKRSVGIHLDIDLVKSFFSTKDSDDFYEFFDKFCEKKFLDISEGTQYHYEILRKRLKQFKREIKFSQINLSFVEKFDSFMKDKLSTGKSGRWGRHKNLKVVLCSALKSNLIKSNPYDEFKITQDEVKLEHLNHIELKLIEKIRFSNFPRGNGLNHTRDMFLFSCYTGLRYSDIITLTNDEVNGEIISTRMNKTKKIVQVPITNKAKIILKKYISSGTKQIFPTRCNVTVNRDLKTIASLCKIKKNVHFHLARHTFASTMANSDVNSFKIMKLLGHSNIKTTQRYVNNSVEDLSKMLEGISAFN